MIERDHEHAIRPINATTLPDGSTAIHSRCQGGCGLEEQRIVRDDIVTKLRYRFGGLWFDAIDLLRIGNSLEIAECDVCGGDPGISQCERCSGALVIGSDGFVLEAPNIRVH